MWQVASCRQVFPCGADLLPPLVLTRWGAALVKTSTVNVIICPENAREFPEVLPVLVLHFGSISAPHYCTRTF